MKKLLYILLFLPIGVSAQNDSIRCFTIEEQRRILLKFSALDECNELRHADSVQIAKLYDELLISKTKTYEVGKVNQELNEKVARKNRYLGVSIAINVGFFTFLLVR